MATRHHIGWGYVKAWWTSHVAPDLQCTACRAAATPFVFTFLLPSSFPNALPQCPLQQTKTNGIQRTTAAAVIDRDLYRGMSGESDGVVYCRSSPHICPVLLGSTSEQFSWERDMQVFFFSFFSTNRCIKLSRAKQQTDAWKEKCFVQAQAVHLGETCFQQNV